LDTFWDFFWFMFWAFMWIIWLILLFRVFGDIFRSDSSGWAKAAWTIFVIIVPFLGVFVYLIVEGRNMAGREVATAQAIDQAQRDYIRSVAGAGSAADQLEKLSALHDAGKLTDAEFAAQKAKILA
jgi:hypothetical protein